MEPKLFYIHELDHAMENYIKMGSYSYCYVSFQTYAFSISEIHVIKY